MQYQNILDSKKEQFKLKAQGNMENQVYYEMLSQVAAELIALEQKVEAIKDQNISKAYKHQWMEIIGELCEILEVLEEQDLKMVKGKKTYEAIDEVIADLEDWIESINEEIGDEEQLPYFESWDIGVFFE
ncbi:MAG: hypothetical protein E7231_03535 [Cellulosilyticum sp.]|nr:hypothetical protein [Cellulosilyticum sp.]